MKWIKSYRESMNESMGQKALSDAIVDAAWGNDLERMTELLRIGADPDSRNHLESTPLHTAARHGYEEMARLLIAHGADLDARDWNGWTPLLDAASSGNIGVAKILIEAGARIDLQGKSGITALWMAHKREGREMARLLLQKGAHPAKGFNDIDELQKFFLRDDLSWYPGGLPAIEKSFRSAEIRKGLF